MQQYPNMAELMRIAQSPAGQKLIALLQKQGGSSLQEAIDKASKGDYNAAKQRLSALLASEDAKKLLKDLEGKP